MRSFLVFIKKEFMEQIRTYKTYIMFCVLLALGIMSPILAKVMPDIISGMDMNGMTIQIQEAVITDAYAQFFKNMTSFGIVLVLLVFGGTLSGELSKGTLVNILAKGLRRRTVILSKYIAAFVLWTLSYLSAVIVNYGYTIYLFEDHKVQNLYLSLICYWIFACMIIALILLSSILAGGNFGGLVLSATAIMAMLFLNIVPEIKKFNPITLVSVNTNLILGTQNWEDIKIAFGITMILIVGCLFISIKLFEKKKI